MSVSFLMFGETGAPGRPAGSVAVRVVAEVAAPEVVVVVVPFSSVEVVVWGSPALMDSRLVISSPRAVTAALATSRARPGSEEVAVRRMIGTFASAPPETDASRLSRPRDALIRSATEAEPAREAKALAFCCATELEVKPSAPVTTRAPAVAW